MLDNGLIWCLDMILEDDNNHLKFEYSLDYECKITSTTSDICSPGPQTCIGSTRHFIKLLPSMAIKVCIIYKPLELECHRKEQS